jgi:hypothetical protein
VLEPEFLEARAILHKFLKRGCCLSHRLIQNKQKGTTVKQTEMMARKVHTCLYRNLGVPSSDTCQKLPSSIPKTAHVKFRATSGSLSTTLW